MMSTTNSFQRSKRSRSSESEPHVFAIGEAVRVKDTFLQSGDGYLVTAKLPPLGGALQYRIRNDSEQFERVTTQDNLERASQSIGSAKATTVRKLFGPRIPRPETADAYDPDKERAAQADKQSDAVPSYVA